MDWLSSLIAGLDNAAVTATSLAFDDYGRSLAIALLAFLLVLRFSTHRASPLFLSLVLSYFAVNILKAVISFPRPCTELAAKVACPLTGSFPSGHSTIAGAFILSSVGTPLFPLFLLIGGFAFFSRIYLGLHTFGDVAAGLAIGVVLYSVSERFYHAYRKAVS